ncbi:MAG: hypothetical protein COA43_12505 [Robiginitomaculum sp.]|nr:MAG: hypothetical protein COA43_12505 [Robiginitomaculum sp.]
MKPVLEIFTFFIAALGVTGLIAPQAFAQQNMMDCEIVVMAPIENISKDGVKDKGPVPIMATFMPANKFIFSVLDAKQGHLEAVGGYPIRALMCTRENVVPTQLDMKFVRTGIPLHLSQDFDSHKSALLSIRKLGGKYVHEYSGAKLSVANEEILQRRLRALNKAEEE